MTRRHLLAAAPAAAAAAAAQAAPPTFGGFVVERARALAARPYQAVPRPLPQELADLDYDGYRDLRFRPQMAVWRDLGLPFQLQMFHRGGLFRDPVDLFEVAGGVPRPIVYRPELFTFGRLRTQALSPDLGFAGFRIHAPMNVPGRYDEVAVFLGASYFRAVARGGVYGLSGRGLALGAGEPGEEFPAFRAFFIERPGPGADTLVVHALMDSPSVAGAFRFLITPGEPTRFDVSASLFPRMSLTRAGIAPLTSMFLFDSVRPNRFDDFRPEVHDSDGLLIANAPGERIWRPLSNPVSVQTSAFQAGTLGGFGLLQRERSFEAYLDLEAQYHLRPGAWVEPLADFGRGDVRLVELPARGEGEDNIVAAWRPEQPLQPGREHRFRYRVRWGAAPAPPDGLAKAVRWRTGSGDGDSRRFVLDFAPLDATSDVRPEITATTGRLRRTILQPNASIGGMRLSFELDPQGAAVSELRAGLSRPRKLASETWMHRWLA